MIEPTWVLQGSETSFLKTEVGNTCSVIITITSERFQKVVDVLILSVLLPPRFTHMIPAIQPVTRILEPMVRTYEAAQTKSLILSLTIGLTQTPNGWPQSC